MPTAPTEVRLRLEGTPLLDVRLSLQPEHQRLQARYAAAITATMKQDDEWLGQSQASSLTIVDPPWQMPAAAAAGDAIVLDRTPWWSASTSMTPEMAVARALSRRRWALAMPNADLPAWFMRGLVEYSARRAVIPIFQAANLSPGYAFLEQRYFGGFVPRFVRIRLHPQADGTPVPAYRANPAVSPALAPRSDADARSLEAKTVLTLGTLERWLGRPVLDQVLAEFVRQTRFERPTLADFTRTASEVSGQDLTWLFDEAFRSSRVFDYGVESLMSEREQDGAFVTVVVARRFGDARFTGASAVPIGPFESGRGITLRVTFEDGQQRTDYWDGRNRAKTFHYRGLAQAVSAEVDPNRTLLLDLKQTNNSMTLAPQASLAASLWAARWLMWLENALLTYGALV